MSARTTRCAFVDGLDLAAASFARVEPKVTGRPGDAPVDLLKLYIYGYLNRVRSSRRLEAETHRNIEVIWLLRHLKPDFKTIADFRRDNRNAFRQGPGTWSTGISLLGSAASPAPAESYAPRSAPAPRRLSSMLSSRRGVRGQGTRADPDPAQPWPPKWDRTAEPNDEDSR